MEGAELVEEGMGSDVKFAPGLQVARLAERVA